ncbi:MAG: RloB family protein [Acidiferrobacteraceae bacterium]
MRDNQPKHRQMHKERRRLARRRASLEGLPSILVVCEGRQTEPNYVDGLREHLRINAAAVHIERGDSVTDPVGLVIKAQKLFKSDRDYDLVYVVCDGDAQHLTAARALAARRLRNSAGAITQVQVIANCPSIEFWLLLHFEYSARPFRTAAEVEQVLRAHLADYRKNDRDIFRKAAAGLDAGCQRVEQLKAELRASGASAPDTDMHLLVDQFRRMQRT